MMKKKNIYDDASLIKKSLIKDLSDKWKSHATLTPLAKQDGPLWLQYN